MTPDPDKWLNNLKIWLEEERHFQERKEMIDEFIEKHQLPKDTTIGELLEFCRKLGET